MTLNKSTSLPEEVHLKMIRRFLFASIVASQFFVFSALGRDNAFPRPDFGSGNGLSLAVLRVDDPYPCPECDPSDPGIRLQHLQHQLA